MDKMNKWFLLFAVLMCSNAFATPDVLVGLAGGGSPGWENTGDGTSPVWLPNPAFNVPDVGRFAVPALTDLNNDGLFDVIVGELAGRARAFENVGTPEVPVWLERSEWAPPDDVGQNAAPGFGDIDGDNLVDLMVGNAAGVIRFYKNTGSATEPQWTEQPALEIDIDHQYAFPRVCDLDGDGDFDLMSGSRSAGVFSFRNVGTVHDPVWEPEPTWSPPKPPGDRTTLAFGDLDNDGDCDALLGNLPGSVFAAENIGGPNGPPEWELRPEWDVGPVGGGCATPTLADLDGDDPGVPGALRADAGPDQNVDDPEGDGELVTLDGSGSEDDDDVIVSYDWSEDGVNLGSGAMLVDVPLGPGEHIITLTVMNDNGEEDMDTVTVTIELPAPPPPAGPTVLTPSAPGITVSRGGTLTVTYGGYTDSNVRIQLYRGITRYVRRLTADSYVANTGTFVWTVPTFLKPRSDYHIKVIGLSNSSESDFSDNPFTID